MQKLYIRAQLHSIFAPSRFLPINPSIIIRNASNMKYLYRSKPLHNPHRFHPKSNEIELKVIIFTLLQYCKVCKFRIFLFFFGGGAENPKIWSYQSEIWYNGETLGSLCWAKFDSPSNESPIWSNKPHDRHLSKFNTGSADSKYIYLVLH